MRREGLLRAIAWLAFVSVCLAPFVAGAVFRSVWIPLAQFWLTLGGLSAVLRWRAAGAGQGDAGVAVSRALLPIHALFAIQLMPMPAGLLRLLSAGSHAAHFLPDPGDGRLRPLSVSPLATIEAWLYVAGLQGLFLALQGFPLKQRRAVLHALLATILLLAGEGLWQSRSAQPHHLYGRIQIAVSSGFETAVFGPYLNRNHFATPMALGAGLGAGLAATLVLENGGFLRLLHLPRVMARVILLAGASVFLTVTAAASGSRSGALAALAALGIVALRTFGGWFLMATLAAGAATVTLTGSASFERFMRLDVVQSRWAPWVDMTTLFRFFPIFGSGIGTFGAAYWPYQRNAAYEFWQYAHNDYLQWLTEAGLVGLLALFLGVRHLRRDLKCLEPARECCLAVTGAFAVQAFLDFPLHVPASAALIICVIALSTERRD